MSFTAFGSVQILNHILRRDTSPLPDPWYLSLHTGAPGNAGVSEVGVQRQAITFDPADEGEQASASSAVLDFFGMPACTVSHIALWDAQNGGNCWWNGELIDPQPVNSGNTFHFDAGGVLAALA